jgi:hypothetical protein
MAAQEPIFATVFGADWSRLPLVLKTHYANRPFCRDVVVVEGLMRVETSWLMRLLGPILRMAGTLPPHAGENIPVTVTFRSEPDSRLFCLDREFRFPGRPPYRFLSRMEPVAGNEIIEWMRGGLGWRAAYSFASGKVRLDHRGYVLKLAGVVVPLPLEILIGRGEASEEALDDERFNMAMSIGHPLLGQVYGYSGVFTVREVRLDG